MFSTNLDVVKSQQCEPCDYVEPQQTTVYQFNVQNLDGSTVCLEQFYGKVLIIVNYACTCGFTAPNVFELSKMSQMYRQYGLEILMFPSNDFFENMLGNVAAKELACDHPEFDVFAQICVNGPEEHPLYTFLKKSLPGPLTTDIEWNFTKFVVDRYGYPVRRYSSAEGFEDLEATVQQLLGQPC